MAIASPWMKIVSTIRYRNVGLVRLFQGVSGLAARRFQGAPPSSRREKLKGWIAVVGRIARAKSNFAGATLVVALLPADAARKRGEVRRDVGAGEWGKFHPGDVALNQTPLGDP
jgi:hypothetical protein